MKDHKSTIKAYDESAARYCDFLNERLPQFTLIKFISYLKKYYPEKKGKMKILDAGCAGGRDVGYLKEEGFSVVGIDASKKVIAEAKKRVKRSKFFVMDIRKPDFKDGSFEGVWCYGPLLHIKKKDSPKVIGNFFKILKKNGVLALTTNEGGKEGSFEKKELGNKKVYCVYYDQKELEQIIEEQGFEILNSIMEEGEEKNITIFAKKP